MTPKHPAPDLLDAAKQAYSVLMGGVPDAQCDEYKREARRNLRAAIAAEEERRKEICTVLGRYLAATCDSHSGLHCDEDCANAVQRDMGDRARAILAAHSQPRQEKK